MLVCFALNSSYSSRVGRQRREGWTNPAVSPAHAPPVEEDGNGAMDHRYESSSSLAAALLNVMICSSGFFYRLG